MAASHDSSSGSFRHDLDRLLEELSKPAIIELGNPKPDARHLPSKRAAKCHAAHNRLLIDRLADADADADR